VCGVFINEESEAQTVRRCKDYHTAVVSECPLPAHVHTLLLQKAIICNLKCPVHPHHFTLSLPKTYNPNPR